ncbi:hypothetical protein AC626_12170 [Pseudoalteromonas rubra]|uniref:Uncharacterized protein n=1 Tax=Pseudoalteromonas rubra TaxID=43658 RepID=A0A0L0ETM5_9GAMM|nr:hypothetical protein AC626_12170 [Pseudoalteromonas rubra]
MRDFAGEASFASAGIGPLMLEGSLSDSGKYGFNTNFGAGYSMSGGGQQHQFLVYGMVCCRVVVVLMN